MPFLTVKIQTKNKPKCNIDNSEKKGPPFFYFFGLFHSKVNFIPILLATIKKKKERKKILQTPKSRKERAEKGESEESCNL